MLALAAALNVRAYTVSSTEEAALPNASRNDYDFDYEFPYDYDLHYDLPLENGNTIDTDTYTYTPTPTRSFWDVEDDLFALANGNVESSSALITVTRNIDLRARSHP